MADILSTGRYDDPFGLTPREKAYADCAQLSDIINQIANGVRPVNIPWGDVRFQDMLLKLISDQRKYKTDADKLAVVRDVFGGR